MLRLAKYLICFISFFSCLWKLTLVYAETLTITKTQNLSFTDAAAGDAKETTSAAAGAQFTVQGTPKARFCATTPAAINMLDAAGNKVQVKGYTASPGFGTNCCLLDAGGLATFSVGGTRQAIGGGDTPGIYSGNFTQAIQYYDTVTSKCAGTTASTTATASFRVVKSIAITKSADLRFGKFAIGDSYVTVSAAASSYPNVGPATFSVTGEPSYAYNVTLSTTTVTMKNGNCGANCQVVVDQLAANAASITADASGNSTVYVGGRRAPITAGKVAGAYSSGTFTVTVTYP